jgi:hypothetical protein
VRHPKGCISISYLAVFRNRKSELRFELIEVLGHTTREIFKPFVHSRRPLRDPVAMETGLLVQFVSVLEKAFHFLSDLLKDT